MTGWTEERRKKQAEIIRQTRPWEKSTGPRSQAGKERASRNSFKDAGHDYKARHLRHALKLQRESLRALIEAYATLKGYEGFKNELKKLRGKSKGARPTLPFSGKRTIGGD